MLLLAARLASAYQWQPTTQTVPEFVIEHAPVVYLYSEERFMPGSLEDFVGRCTLSGLNLEEHEIALNNLTTLASKSNNSSPLFLSTQSGFDPPAEWLSGVHTRQPNVVNGRLDSAFATLILVDKPHINALDAFWFYFYPFNLGPFVMGHGPFGNHFGDWEHSLVRFNRKTHEPETVFMSAHGGGSAYQYSALTTDLLNRPAIYSARGTHAQYSGPGRFPHDIPWHMLSDYTDRGTLWDPALNYCAYTLNGSTVHPANGSHPHRELELGDWLLFDGHWGDQQLPKTHKDQQWSPFEFRMIDGPKGPLFKNLQRFKVCERSKWYNIIDQCTVHHQKTPGEGIDGERARGGWFPYWARYFFFNLF